MVSVFFPISKVNLFRDRITVGEMTYLTSNLYTVSDVTLNGDREAGSATIALGFVNLKNVLETVLIHGGKKEVDGLLYQLKYFGLPEHKKFWDSRS